MEIDAIEFKSLRFNVHELGPTQNVLDKFERLKIVPEFHFDYKKVNKNALLKYIIYVYDKNSPFRNRIKEIDKRKVYAALEAGLIKDIQNIPEKIQDILSNKIVQINQMIIEYVRLFHEHKFAYMIGLEHLYYSQMKSIMDGSDSIKIKELSETEKLLEQVVSELLGEERDLEIKRDMHEIVVFKKLELRPEDIAKMLIENRRFRSSEYKL
jgi:hypothetical protein